MRRAATAIRGLTGRIAGAIGLRPSELLFLSDMPAEIDAALPDADRARRAVLREEIAALERTLPAPPAEAWALKEEGNPTTVVWKRGEVGQIGRAHV